MLQFNPLCLQQLCWNGWRLSHPCPHPSASVPRRTTTCVFTSKSGGPFEFTRSSSKARLSFVSLLFPLPPLFLQPKRADSSTCSSPGWLGGSFPACTSHSYWGHVSCLQSHSSYTYLLCAGSKNRTSRQAASVGAGKINRVIKKADLVCNWFTYHVSLKSKHL